MNKEKQNLLIADRIKNLANENNYSINQLAKASNIRQSTISGILNEGKIPTVSTLF